MSQEEPHETYLRWATDFGLIEWVVDEDGEVYFVAADCTHECMHTEDELAAPAPPAHWFSHPTKKRMSARLMTTAVAATAITVGVQQMAVSALPQMVYTATSGEQIVVRGSHAEIIPAKAKNVAAPIEPVDTSGWTFGKKRSGTDVLPGEVHEHKAKDEVEKKRKRARKRATAVPVRSKGYYKDHRRAEKKAVTPLKTAKRSHINKVAPPAKKPAPAVVDVVPAVVNPAPVPAAPHAHEPTPPVEVVTGPATPAQETPTTSL